MIPLAALPPAYNPGGLDPYQITALINQNPDPTLLDFSFQILDKFSLQPIDIPGEPGLEPGDVSQWVTMATVECNTQRDVHRQGSIDMVDLPGLSFDPLFHRLRVYCDFFDRTYDNPNATRLLHWPIATFMAVLSQRDLSDNGIPIWHLLCYDEMYKCARMKFSNDYHVVPGRRYTEVMNELMILANDGSAVTPDGCRVIGPGYPQKRVFVEQDDDIVITDILWKAGQDMILPAVNMLANQKPNQFYPAFADELSSFHSFGQPYYTAEKPQLGWTYDSREPNIMVPPVKQAFSDWSTLFNELKVIVEPANGTAFWVTVQNNTADSAISIPNLHEIVPETIHDDTAPSPDAAALKAAVLLQQAAVLNDSLTWTTIANPAHQVHDSLGIWIYGRGEGYYVGSGADIKAEFLQGPQLVSSDGYLFEEISWSINCNTREMTHTAGKQVSI